MGPMVCSVGVLCAVAISASFPFLSLMLEEFWVLVCEATEDDKAKSYLGKPVSPTGAGILA